MESEQTSMWFTKHLLIIMNPRSHVILFSAPWHINRLISRYKEKQVTFLRKQERKKIKGNMTPVFTGRILFWMALLFWLAYLIVIIVLGSLPSSI